jgi:hypothetical protein
MDYRGNGYADYNRRTVVVGVFYRVLLKLLKERLQEREFERIQTLQDLSCYQVEQFVRHSVTAGKPSVEENSEDS